MRLSLQNGFSESFETCRRHPGRTRTQNEERSLGRSRQKADAGVVAGIHEASVGGGSRCCCDGVRKPCTKLKTDALTIIRFIGYFLFIEFLTWFPASRSEKKRNPNDVNKIYY